MNEFNMKREREIYFEKQRDKKIWLRGRKYVEHTQEYVPFERQHSERRGRAHRFVKYLREHHTDMQHLVSGSWRAMLSKKYIQQRTYWAEKSNNNAGSSYRQGLANKKTEKRRDHRRARRDLEEKSMNEELI